MKNLFKRFEKIIKYFSYSCIATVIDAGIVWLLYGVLDLGLVMSNTIGVVTGFIVSYLLSTESVFDTKLGIAGFLVFFGTFIFGLLLADFLIVVSNDFTSPHFPQSIAFILSKGVSVALPFFVLYFLRKYLYSLLHKKRGNNHE